MRYMIKSRLAALNKKSVDVIDELRRRGINTNPGEFSLAVNGRLATAKADRICSVADEILTEWESIRK